MHAAETDGTAKVAEGVKAADAAVAAKDAAIAEEAVDRATALHTEPDKLIASIPDTGEGTALAKDLKAKAEDFTTRAQTAAKDTATKAAKNNTAPPTDIAMIVRELQAEGWKVESSRKTWRRSPRTSPRTSTGSANTPRMNSASSRCLRPASGR